LLTEPGGLLDTLSRDAQISVRFDATVVGGTKRRGLVVAVGTALEQADAAIDALKKLFAELGNGSKPATINYPELDAWYQEREYGRRSDPRQRLVELWSRTGVVPETSADSFRAYLRRAFTEGELMVVRATPKPEKAQVRPASSPVPSSPKSRGKAKSASRP
jgi:hypothetical protein